MAALDFPASPSTGQTYGSWSWDGAKWGNGASTAAGIGGTIDGRDYGIVADGVTDDTVALAAAIAAAQATVSGGQCFKLMLPKGRILTGPQTLGREIFIQGVQDNSTVLVLKTGSTAPLFTIHTAGAAFPGGTPPGRIVLQDLRIECQSGKVGNANARGIYCEQSTSWACHVTLQRVTLYGLPSDGISGFVFNGWVDFYDCNIFNNGACGVNCNSCSDWHFYGGTIGVNTTQGVILSGCAQFVFLGTNIFSNGTANVQLYGGPGLNNGWHLFTDCMFDRGGQAGLVYDIRGNLGTVFKGCTFGLCSQVTPNTYSDVLISSTANNNAMFSGCFWSNNYANDVTNPEKWALEFQGATQSVTLDGTNTFSGDVLRTNGTAAQILLMAKVGVQAQYSPTPYLQINPGVLTYTSNVQYAGYALSNGTNIVAKMSGFSATNDNGVFQLLNAGVIVVQLSAAFAAPNYINSVLYLGNGATNAAPFAQSIRATDGVGTDIVGANFQLAAGRSTGAGTPGRIRLFTAPATASGATLNTEVERMSIDGPGNVVVGTAALATTATNGFFYIPTCAGTPTGVPTANAGRVPMVFDTTANKFWLYSGTWKGVVVA